MIEEHDSRVIGGNERELFSRACPDKQILIDMAGPVTVVAATRPWLLPSKELTRLMVLEKSGDVAKKESVAVQIQDLSRVPDRDETQRNDLVERGAVAQRVRVFGKYRLQTIAIPAGTMDSDTLTLRLANNPTRNRAIMHEVDFD